MRQAGEKVESVKRNRHFYEADDISEEFRQTPRNEIDVRLSYPLRFFQKLPKENLTVSDFPQLIKEVCIPRFEPKPRKIVKTFWIRASWKNGKGMYGKDSAIRDIHAQLIAGIHRK
jgi:hypothetical protein